MTMAEIKFSLTGEFEGEPYERIIFTKEVAAEDMGGQRGWGGWGGKGDGGAKGMGEQRGWGSKGDGGAGDEAVESRNL
ncbi:hypothetical protein MiSe_79870 [Microseira wollei NIES-4236]|uniref:Uncharacterized protein n=1 Tax=Microseira wollei NIES-4236 TaxID=2530354 RepID=A0AAV3XQH6_9CYAN|nr:hypothetical protein MiSe_79870 [Microseira wollei NIES-4236]